MLLLPPLPRRRRRARARPAARPSTYGASSTPLSGCCPADDCAPFSLGCRWNPAKCQPLERGDRDVERQTEHAGEKDARPRLVELEDARPCEDQHTERIE